MSRRWSSCGHLGVCYKTAWLVKAQAHGVVRQREDGRQLTGRVEMDDAYLGGERQGGKVGAASENKVSSSPRSRRREDGRPCWHAWPFSRLPGEAVSAFAAKSLIRPLTVGVRWADVLHRCRASRRAQAPSSPAAARPA